MNPYGIPSDAIDIAAMHAWNFKNRRARQSYYDDPFALTRDSTSDAAQRMRVLRQNRKQT